MKTINLDTTKSFIPGQSQKGYTLLFAVLLSSLLLAVGLSILNISRKESILASAARESQIALYAADTAVECATYFSQNLSGGTVVFATPNISNDPSNHTFDPATYDPLAPISPGAPAAVEFVCKGQTVTPTTEGTVMTPNVSPNNQAAYRYTFYLNLSNGTEKACAEVKVLSGLVYNEAASDESDFENYVPQIRIEARGYNAGWNGTNCLGASVKKVERAIRVTI